MRGRLGGRRWLGGQLGGGVERCSRAVKFALLAGSGEYVSMHAFVSL